ncbi:hypothetical protein [Roseateles puraquae]|jgi:hypothetical protein|uniref:hypothetical protein n=1 Tax=Roseateles puraquae TaxID=431059 RepID=UPI0031DF53D7
MSLDLSRRALYDLVWSRPRAQIAKELGVSDVWIGKQCRAMDVPAPPRGYWANLQATRRSKPGFIRPPLTYSLSQRMAEDREDVEAPYVGCKARDLTQPLPPPPAYPSDEATTVARYLAMVRKELARPRAVGRHPVTQALIEQDERRAHPQYARSWLQPLYRGPKGEAVLQAIDTLAWAWTRCGLSVCAHGGHEIELTVSGGGLASHFDIRRVEAAPGRGRHNGTRKASESGLGGLGVWLYKGYEPRDPKAKPLRVVRRMTSAVVVELTELLLAHGESRYRAWLAQRYHFLAQERAAALREIEEAQRLERERIEAERRALEQRRRHLLRHAVASIRRADDIRGLVAELDARTWTQAFPAWATWRTWALDQADEMDVRQLPRSASRTG